MRYFVVFVVSAHFSHFEPTHIADRLGRTIYGMVYCGFDTFRGGTNQLDLFVDVVNPSDLIKLLGTAESKCHVYINVEDHSGHGVHFLRMIVNLRPGRSLSLCIGDTSRRPPLKPVS